MQDISERKLAQEQMKRLAYREPVTGLPNRTAMHHELARLLTPERLGGHFALVLLNLDYFRDINDSLGHQNGDFLLRALAERLRGELHHCASVGSLGGDEFALVMPQVTCDAEAEHQLELVQRCLQEPIEVAGIAIRLEATAGVVV